MEFKTKTPTREITPQEIANNITNNILLVLNDKIYELVEYAVYDKLAYEYDIDIDNTNTNDLNGFIGNVYNIVCDNIKEGF